MRWGSADIGGRFADPVIRGSLRTQNARLESQVTGMVIEQLTTQARFSGPQLIYNQISGTTSGGGSVTGNGTITFSGGRTALNLGFNASQALLLNRDDVAARVTGPLQIRSDGQNGTISGDLKMNKGRFQLGRASAAAAVPRLNVREIGLDPEDVIEAKDLHPWKLAIKLTGNDVQVTGLGINSRWTTALLTSDGRTTLSEYALVTDAGPMVRRLRQRGYSRSALRRLYDLAPAQSKASSTRTSRRDRCADPRSGRPSPRGPEACTGAAGRGAERQHAATRRQRVG
jgi:hypothetical protein